MSTQKMFKVGMIMDKGGKTQVIVSAMNRADAINQARSQNPTWRCTGEVQELGI